MDGRGGPAHGPQDAEADERRLLAAADVEAARARVRRAEAAKRAADAVRPTSGFSAPARHSARPRPAAKGRHPPRAR